MEIASEYVKTNLGLDLNDQKFAECIETLKQMFLGKTQIPELFESVIVIRESCLFRYSVIPYSAFYKLPGCKLL